MGHLIGPKGARERPEFSVEREARGGSGNIGTVSNASLGGLAFAFRRFMQLHVGRKWGGRTRVGSLQCVDRVGGGQARERGHPRACMSVVGLTGRCPGAKEAVGRDP